MSKKKTLAQYFTPPPIADLLVNYLSGPVLTALDLAGGQGELLQAVSRSYPRCHLFGVDIDPQQSTSMRSQLPEACIYEGDALALARKRPWADQVEYFDLVVCNPPFQVARRNQYKLQLIKSCFGIDCSSHKRFRSELAFIAEGLNQVKNGGYVSIILPRAFANSRSYEQLRRILIDHHCLVAAIDLPAGTFPGTEIKTTIFVVKKGGTTKSIPVLCADTRGRVIGDIDISPAAGYVRLDYHYNQWVRNRVPGQMTLGDLNPEIVRGDINFTAAKASGRRIFHTCHFGIAEGGTVNLDGWYQGGAITGDKSAEKDDFIFSRIGRQYGRSVFVASGKAEISDCVFRVRVPKKCISVIRETLETGAFREYLDAHASGSCTQVLRKQDLYTMPLVGAR